MNKLRRAEISFDGLNVEKAVNMIIKQQIDVFYVKRLPNRRCVVAVPSNKRQQVVALLQQKCYNNIQCKLCGIDAVGEQFKKHIAVAIVLLLVLPLFMFATHICTDVRISGTADSSKVQEVLTEQGVYKGSWLNGIDFDAVENALASYFDSMYAIVSRRGSVVYVQLIERDTGLPDIDYDQRYDIVAQCDGIISRMTVVQGTALVKVGDNVKKGQVLIEGKRTFWDGSQEDVRAVGEVYATVSSSAYQPYSGQIITTVDTQQSFSYVVVQIGNASSSAPAIDYELYRQEQHTVTLYPFNIKLIYYTVYEQKHQIDKVTFEQDIERLTELAYNTAKTAVSWTPTDKQVDIKQGKGVTVTIFGEICITDNL